MILFGSHYCRTFLSSDRDQSVRLHQTTVLLSLRGNVTLIFGGFITMILRGCVAETRRSTSYLMHASLSWPLGLKTPGFFLGSSLRHFATWDLRVTSQSKTWSGVFYADPCDRKEVKPQFMLLPSIFIGSVFTLALCSLRGFELILRSFASKYIICIHPYYKTRVSVFVCVFIR